MGNKTVIKGVKCPVARGVEVIGDKWAALILRDLFLQGPRRFQDFSDSLNGISPNILSGRIKKLLELDIIQTQQYSMHPPRNEYTLSEKGKDLGLVIAGLRDWGNKHTSA